MFTADGELREGFEELADAAEAARAEPTAPEPAAPPAAAEASPPVVDAGEAPPETEAPGRVDLPPATSPYGSPTFMDLVGMLAEPATIYLGDAQLPSGETAENLDLARLHIDLLDVLREKSVGNLSAQEKTILDDLLYRLRMRYVQKQG